MAKNRKIRIGLTGGGSGGHMYPLLAVAESIKKISSNSGIDIDIQMHYFGNPGIYAQELVQDNVKISRIWSVKFRRYFSFKNIVDIMKFPFVLIQSLLKVLIVMPDIMFSKGGTASFPVVLSAWFFRIPIFIHESDTVPGMSNKIAYKFAKRVGVSFEYTKENFWNEIKTAIIGNPVRPYFIEDTGEDKQKSKKILGFDPSLPLILIIGGSLGSQRINEFLLDNIEELITKYQILHITGNNNFKSFQAELAVATKNLIKEQKERYKIVGYLGKDMKNALIASDLVISRSGSGAIFEIATFGKPSILIPLKESAGNHQLYNAYEYAKNGASSIIEEDNLTDGIFFSQIEEILSNKEKFASMSNASKQFSKPDASNIIAKEILNMVL